ncbi:hypothetical protein LSI01_18160 [Furfurilactobacillus siliginis]|uniref:DNA-3-methyladenine glycosylase I n=1 Tax=Furfurilactobacillus siliginis TaxID=348151 RepID=A0A510VWY0_9LACO|nr:hypothetical protein LSI01_18160 [Furfurilactobacillus siliginis]
MVDDDLLFKQLCLQIFQTGLSWSLILQRRDALSNALAQFDVDTLAGFTQREKQMYLNKNGVIANPRKLDAIVHNAQCWQETRHEGLAPLAQLLLLQADYQTDEDPKMSAEAVCTFTGQTRQKFMDWSMIWVGPGVTRNLLAATGFIDGHEVTCDANK